MTNIIENKFNNEEFREIGDHSDYLISNYGRVFSKKRNFFRKLTVSSGDKYPHFQIRVNGKRKKLYVHRLVAKNFVSGFSDGMEVNHRDGNEINNYFENLEWVSRSDNVKHAVDYGMRKYNSGKDHALSVKIVQINLINVKWMSIL